MQEHRHSGARAAPASPKARNTDQTNQSLGLCSWVPGPALTGRPGTTREFFSSLLVAVAAGYRTRLRAVCGRLLIGGAKPLAEPSLNQAEEAPAYLIGGDERPLTGFSYKAVSPSTAAVRSTPLALIVKAMVGSWMSIRCSDRCRRE